MSNMAYCRFQNTLNDFLDCAQAFKDLREDSDAEPLSADELEAAKRLMIEAHYAVEELLMMQISTQGPEEAAIEAAIDSLQVTAKARADARDGDTDSLDSDHA